MTPKPYSEKSTLPSDSPDDVISEIPSEVLPQTPSPVTVSAATTPSPTPQEQVPVETFVDSLVIQENNRMPDIGVTPCYPTPGDIMPYDHSLPDFIRQITNTPNLTDLQSLSLRVVSTLISLHRMSTYLPNLRELDLEGSVLNSLRDIGCSLKHLKVLKVGRCQLESLDGTFGLSSLRELYAQKNFINDVSPCSNLPHIRHIDVSGNRIRNISYAGFLSVCTKLKSMVLTGNPATEAPDYRKYFRRILPQVETLDGIPFVNEDESTQPEQENYCEGSDGSSMEISEFASVSPSDSIENLFNSESLFLSDKENKQAKNLANKDQSGATELKMEGTSNELITNSQLQGNLQNQTSQGEKEFLEEEKTNDIWNANLTQKCTSIQKLDKDIKNRSKKSNLTINSSLGEGSDFAKCSLPEGKSVPSTSTSAKDNLDNDKFSSAEYGDTRTFLNMFTSISSTEVNPEEKKFKDTQKRLSSAASPSKINWEERGIDESRDLNKLTSGLPVCGNLTAALRYRKKIRSAWTLTQNYLSQEIPQLTSSEPNVKKSEIEEHDWEYNVSPDSALDDKGSSTKDVLSPSSRESGKSYHRLMPNNKIHEEDKNDEGKKLAASDLEKSTGLDTKEPLEN